MLRWAMSILRAQDVGAVRRTPRPASVRNRSRFSSTVRSRNGLFGPRGGDGAAQLPDLRLAGRVDVGQPLVDEHQGVPVQRLEVVRRVVEVLSPVEPEPADVLPHRFDELRLLGVRVGVVEAEVAAPPGVFGRDPEVETDGLGVADVQEPVGFRREAGDDAPAVLPGLEVPRDHLPDEVHHHLSGRANSPGAYTAWVPEGSPGRPAGLPLSTRTVSRRLAARQARFAAPLINQHVVDFSTVEDYVHSDTTECE